MTKPDAIPKEEVDALAVLAKSHRLVVILVPADAPDRLVAHLTAWSNYILDSKMIPPLPTPVERHGDGLVCPYCNVPATTRPQDHVEGCDWRVAILRWGAAQLQIERDFPEVG